MFVADHDLNLLDVMNIEDVVGPSQIVVVLGEAKTGKTLFLDAPVGDGISLLVSFPCYFFSLSNRVSS